MIVRDARAADATAWRAIILEAAREGGLIAAWPEEVWSEVELVERFRTAERDSRAYLVAEGDGGVLGVLLLARGARPATRHTAEIGATVARTSRGRGVGTALLRAAEERAQAWGAQKLCLGVFASNARAGELYRRLGFVEEGVRRRHFLVAGVLEDEIMMAKWLVVS